MAGHGLAQPLEKVRGQLLRLHVGDFGDRLVPSHLQELRGMWEGWMVRVLGNLCCAHTQYVLTVCFVKPAGTCVLEADSKLFGFLQAGFWPGQTSWPAPPMQV